LPPSRRTAEFSLGESAAISACLRGHHFEGEEYPFTTTIPPVAGDVVLASQDGRPIWLQRRVDGAEVTLVAWPLPHFTTGDHIYENFQPKNFLRLLPLLQFIHNLTHQEAWQSPPTPACLLIDDPNLHAATYGYLDFRKLVTAAREQKFYVSIASVPLDCWGIHREVRELFHQNAPRVSVLLHGNNHTYEELAHPESESETLSLLAQALRRFQRLQDAGIEVCRLMESPHGSLSAAMLEPMARLGYEAVFASTAHLLRCNPGETFRASLGAERTLLGRRMVTVIPRIRANAGWQTEVRLAAFLRQPIILAAHHWDFAEHHSLVNNFVGLVNSLPGVCWASPTGVARACYQYRQIADVLHLKLDSRLVEVPVPRSVASVMVHRPWLSGEEESELLIARAQGKVLTRVVSSAGVIGPIPVQGSTVLQISSALQNALDCNSVQPPEFRSWPLVRKLMVEVRDRSRLHVRLRRLSKQIEVSTGQRASEENRGSRCRY